MRKKELMIAAAVAALVAGTGLAGAQSNPSSSAPAEKSAPSAGERSGGANQMQMKDDKGARGAKGSETTGQAPSSGQSGGASQLGDDKGSQQEKGQGAQQQKSQSQGVQQQKNQGAQQQQQRRNETTGQAPSSGRTGTGAQQNQMNQPGQNQNQMGTGRSGEPSGQAPARGESNQGRTGTSSSTTTNTDVTVNLNPEQKTKIHEVIVKERSAPRVANVDFSLTVGTPVPRTVKRARLPRTVVEIQPSWRDYEYFLVGDQLVIVDPRSLKIVAIIDV